MTPKTYNIITDSLVLSCFLSGPFVIQYYNTSISLNILKTLVAVLTLLCGVYFQISDIKTLKVHIKPYLVIIFGILYLAMSLYTPGHRYYWANEVYSITYGSWDTDYKEKINNNAITDNCPDGDGSREFIARHYFYKTGEKIDFLTDDKEIMRFIPTEKDILKRVKEIGKQKESLDLKNKLRNIILLNILVISMIVGFFLLLIRLVPPNSLSITRN